MSDFLIILSWFITYPIIDIIWNKNRIQHLDWFHPWCCWASYLTICYIWHKISSYATVGHHHHDYLLPFLPSFLSQKSFPIIIKAEVKILNCSPENIHKNFKSNFNWPWFDATNKWLLGKFTDCISEIYIWEVLFYELYSNTSHNLKTLFSGKFNIWSGYISHFLHVKHVKRNNKNLTAIIFPATIQIKNL